MYYKSGKKKKTNIFNVWRLWSGVFIFYFHYITKWNGHFFHMGGLTLSQWLLTLGSQKYSLWLTQSRIKRDRVRSPHDFHIKPLLIWNYHINFSLSNWTSVTKKSLYTYRITIFFSQTGTILRRVKRFCFAESIRVVDY